MDKKNNKVTKSEKRAKSVGKANNEKPKKAKKEEKKSTIKRNKNAYMFFVADKRADVVKENPDMQNKDIVRKLGDLWKELDKKSKAKYEKLAEADKERYEKEKAQEKAKEEGAAKAPKQKKKPAAGKENKRKKEKPIGDDDPEPIEVDDDE